MRNILYFIFSFSLLCLEGACFGSLEKSICSVDLPEVAQDSNVHNLAKTYCRALWEGIKTDSEADVFSSKLKEAFADAISELGAIIENIKNLQPILVGGQINLSRALISDRALLEMSDFFDNKAYPLLKMALISMSVKGKHKGSSDFDCETKAHVSEVFAYAWGVVKSEPHRLPWFLLGLLDAAPTCIQGYSVRMLCAVHPPRLKTNGRK